MARIASATGVPCATRTSTWRSLEMISSGVCLFLPIVILLWLRSHTSGWTTPTGADQSRGLHLGRASRCENAERPPTNHVQAHAKASVPKPDVPHGQSRSCRYMLVHQELGLA